MSSARSSTVLLCVAAALLAVASLWPDESTPSAGAGARPPRDDVPPEEPVAALLPSAGVTAPGEVVRAGAPSSTASISTGLLLRDGEPGAGRVLASRLDDHGALAGEVVELAADDAGCLDLTALSPGWWRVESAVPNDTILGLWSRRLPPRKVTGHHDAMLLGWKVTDSPAFASSLELIVDPASDVTDVLCVFVASPVQIRGRVIDDATEAPISAAHVDVVRDREVRASSAVAPDGSFSLRLRPSELVGAHLVARAAGWGSACGWRVDAAEELTLRLRRGALTLEGRVVDVNGDGASATVQVAVSDDRGNLWLPGTSGPDGRFRIEGVPVGRGGLGPRCTRVTVEARTKDAFGRRSHVLPAGQPLEVVVRRPAALTVFPLDADGESLGWSARAGELELLEPRDDQDVKPMAIYAEGPRLEWSGWDDTVVTVMVSASGHLPRRLVTRLPMAPIRSRLERGSGIVRGVVVDPTGRPIAKAGLELEWIGAPGPVPSTVRRGEVLELPGTSGRWSLSTDDEGAFTFDGLPAGGRFSVTAGGGDSLPERRDDVSDGAVLQLVLAPRPPHAPVAFTLQVREAATGAAVSDELRVRIDRGSATTARRLAPGSPGFSLEEAGPCRLQVLGAGWVPSSVFEVDVVLGTTVELGHVPLARAGSLRLAIGGWPAAPVALLRARWHDPDGRAREATSAAETEWLLEGVAPGSVTLQLEAVEPGGTVVRRVVLHAEARVGQVTAVAVDLGGD